jgi:formylglycine-generating enzyme required for sulfatase activity
MRVLGLLLLLIGLNAGAKAESALEIYIKGGTYTPFFQDKNETDQQIEALWVDKFPVTNRDFLAFVKVHPEWRKSSRKMIFAGAGYLEHWQTDLVFSKEQTLLPATNVSWFAARKYCESFGKRLMTIAEWEYVSKAQDPAVLGLVLDWYGKTDDKLKPVTKVPANSFGIVGMHGLIWEWVEDFSSAIVAGDSRSSNETGAAMFCGSGSLKAKDPSQYATFMRFAYRSSLKADSTGRNLGFRCAKSAE